MATKTAKPKGVIKKSAPTPFKPKSLGKAVTPTKKPTLPTTKRSVGTQVPSAPKPKGVVKSIKPSGVAKAPKTSYTAPMAKPKGVIAGVNKVLDVLQCIRELVGWFLLLPQKQQPNSPELQEMAHQFL